MEETKTIIRSILTSTPLNMTMKQLVSDYRETVGGPIPYSTFGYSNIEHFLRSIPDVVVIEGTGPFAKLSPVTSDKSAHVNDLVVRQRITKKPAGFSRKKRCSYDQPQSGQKMKYPPTIAHASHPSTNYATANYAPAQFAPKKFSSENCVSKNYTPASFPPVNCAPTSGFPASCAPTKRISAKFASPNWTTIKYASSKPSDQQSIAEPSYDKKMSDYSNSEPIEVTNSELKNNLVPTSKLKYQTLPEMNKLHSKSVQVSDNLKLTNENPKNPYQETKLRKNLCISKNNSFTNNNCEKNRAGIVKNLNQYDQERNVPAIVQKNLKQLIGQYQNGIWCAELPIIYEEMFGTKLRYDELGFRSLIDLCGSLPSIFHYVRPSSDDFKLYDSSKPLPDCAETNFTFASYDVPGEKREALPALDWDDLTSFLPEGVFPPGEEIPRLFLSDDVKTDDNIKVGIGEISDISKFWVYLSDGDLDELMNDLQYFYLNNSEKYIIPKSVINPGVYCVQAWQGEYHRGLILEVNLKEDKIKIIYIDYGTVSIVSRKGLCFLHENFAKLPAQAIRCRLANIQPIQEGHWPGSATNRFRELVINRSLKGKIMRVDHKFLTLDLYLCDVTNPDNPFYINDKLVKEQHAIYTDQEQKKRVCNPKPLIECVYLFPTHEELERGLAPSLEEMEKLYSMKIPLSFALPKYYKNLNPFELDQEVNLYLIEYHLKKKITPPNYDISARLPEFDKSILEQMELNLETFLRSEDIKELLNIQGSPEVTSENNDENTAEDNSENVENDIENFFEFNQDLTTVNTLTESSDDVNFKTNENLNALTMQDEDENYLLDDFNDEFYSIDATVIERHLSSLKVTDNLDKNEQHESTLMNPNNPFLPFLKKQDVKKPDDFNVKRNEKSCFGSSHFGNSNNSESKADTTIRKYVKSNCSTGNDANSNAIKFKIETNLSDGNLSDCIHVYGGNKMSTEKFPGAIKNIFGNLDDVKEFKPKANNWSRDCSTLNSAHSVQQNERNPIKSTQLAVNATFQWSIEDGMSHGAVPNDVGYNIARNITYSNTFAPQIPPNSCYAPPNHDFYNLLNFYASSIQSSPCPLPTHHPNFIPPHYQSCPNPIRYNVQSRASTMCPPGFEQYYNVNPVSQVNLQSPQQTETKPVDFYDKFNETLKSQTSKK